jgi:hypothetical protein
MDGLGSDRSVGPDDWAAIVHRDLKESGGNVSYLAALASYYFSHLVMASKASSLLNPVAESPFVPSQKPWW